MSNAKQKQSLYYRLDDALKKTINFTKKVLLIDHFNKKRFIKSLETRINSSTSDRKIFFISTPCHGNLGDHAIVFAQEKFIRKLYPKSDIVEFTSKEFSAYNKTIKKYVSSNDLILINGGGNLGTIWEVEDDIIAEAIATYKDNKIVVFPQTCYYSGTSESNSRLSRNNKIYKSAKNLTIFLRDKRSYDFCKKNFVDVNFKFAPDIVLFIDDLNFKLNREGCLLVFRTDLESVLKDSTGIKIKNYLSSNGYKYSCTDTVVRKHIDMHTRDEYLNNKWTQFASSKLVITDRLHGMIFAAITNTPCIALDNSSKKVSGVYRWMKHLSYIKVCLNDVELINSIEEFYCKADCQYSNKEISNDFDTINNTLNS